MLGMRPWVGKTVKLVSAAALVHACAGKSITRGGDDDPPPDDGLGNGGFANAGYGGEGGTTVGKGGSPGKGGGGTGGTTVPRGGTAGRGGTSGFGGTSGRGGTSGFGGTGGDAGETGGGIGPGGSGGCPPSRNGSMASSSCNMTPGCISLQNPTSEIIRPNQIADDQSPGGAGGEGGGWSEEAPYIASALNCSTPQGEGYLAFDYFYPENARDSPFFSLYSGRQLCSGYLIANGTFSDYSAPPRGTWSTQCFAISEDDMYGKVTIGVQSASRPWAHVRNVRYVSNCVCPRQITRFTTCGDIKSPDVCP